MNVITLLGLKQGDRGIYNRLLIMGRVYMESKTGVITRQQEHGVNSSSRSRFFQIYKEMSVPY
jgi:hypothetical protein